MTFRLSGFPVVSGTLVNFVVLSGVFNVIIYAVYPSVPVRQCDNATGIISGKFLENRNTQVQREVIKTAAE